MLVCIVRRDFLVYGLLVLNYQVIWLERDEALKEKSFLWDSAPEPSYSVKPLPC